MPNDEQPAARHAPRMSSRALVLILVALAAAIAGGVVLIQLLAAERMPELTEERLEAAQRLWDDVGPASYDMEIDVRGARPATIRIAVRDGEPTAVTHNDRSPAPHTWDVWSVRGMFETLERELELAEDPQHEMGAAAGTHLQLRCEFDPQFGFPRRYHRFATGGAPEVFWRVRRVEPR